jgi:hypothetical protein
MILPFTRGLARCRSTIEFIPLSFWYAVPLTPRYRDRRYNPWPVYGSPTCSPARWVPGFHQRDPGRVSAAGLALRGGVPGAHGGVAPGWEAADGGGQVVRGAERLSHFVLGVARRSQGTVTYELAPIKGETALILRRDGRLISILAIDTDGTHLLAVYNVRNPQKLRRMALPEPHAV